MGGRLLTVTQPAIYKTEAAVGKTLSVTHVRISLYMSFVSVHGSLLIIPDYNLRDKPVDRVGELIDRKLCFSK